MPSLDGATVVAILTGVISVTSAAVALYVRAVKAELLTKLMMLRSEANDDRARLALQIEQTRLKIIEHVGTEYVRRENCALREEGLRELVSAIRRELDRE